MPTTPEFEELDRSLSELLRREADAAPGTHLEPETLADLLDGALTDSEADAAREHLATCRECTRALLDLEDLASGGQATEDEVTDFEVAAAYRQFRAQARLDDEPATRPALEGPGPPRPARRRWLEAAAVLATAAALILAVRVVQLERGVTRLEGVVTRLEAPSTAVPILYLQDVRSAETPSELEVGASERFVVVLPLADPEAFASYEAAVVDAAGSELWRGSGLEPSGLGALRLGFSRAMLPPGRYDLRFFGVGGDGLEPLADFALELR